MVAVGFVLLVLSALIVAGIVLTNGESVEAEAFGVSLENVSVGGFFLVGAVVGIVAMSGLGLMLAGAARKRAKRVAAKREVRNVRGERENLAEENARLQAELERTAALPASDVPTDGSSAEHHVGDDRVGDDRVVDGRVVADRGVVAGDTDLDAPGRYRS